MLAPPNRSRSLPCGQSLKKCAQQQRRLARLGDCWARSQHIVVLILNCPENFLSAAAEQRDVNRNLLVDPVHQGFARRKQFLRELHFVFHQIAKSTD